MAIIIPRRGSKPPEPGPKKPVVLPPVRKPGMPGYVPKPEDALDASAFNRTGTQTLDRFAQKPWDEAVAEYQQKEAVQERTTPGGIIVPERRVIVPGSTAPSDALAELARRRKGLPTRPADAVVMPLPAATHSKVQNFNIEALLAKHPLPLTPDGKEFILDPWQVEDITTLVQWDRVGAFLPVGAGKTVIATLVGLAWDLPFYVVVVLPILVKQWVEWLNSIPNTGGAVAYEGGPKKRAEINLMKFRWWVMSYGLFKNDFDKLLKLLPLKTDAALIVDEAQSIKDTSTQLWKRCNEFSLGRSLIEMSGTELNKPDDAYGHIKIKTPSVYRSFGHFEQVHVASKDFFGKVQGWRELDLLNRNLYLQSVQRTKEEVHSLVPKARYMPYPYDLAPAHMKLYKQLTEQQILELESGGKFDATTEQALYNYSQQLVVNWADFCGDESVRPAIFDVIDQLIDSTGIGQPNGPNKFIIWCWFKVTTARIAAYLETMFPGRVVKAYSDSDSKKSVARFMEDPECMWLVANPGSAGAGLNPQYICYNCLFVETPTRTIQFRQAAGRLDRKGQPLNANIWIAQARDTIQVKLYENLLTNDALVQRVQGNARDLRKMINGG
jgi:hypothetical protein